MKKLPRSRAAFSSAFLRSVMSSSVATTPSTLVLSASRRGAALIESNILRPSCHSMACRTSDTGCPVVMTRRKGSSVIGKRPAVFGDDAPGSAHYTFGNNLIFGQSQDPLGVTVGKDDLPLRSRKTMPTGWFPRWCAAGPAPFARSSRRSCAFLLPGTVCESSK